MAPYNLENEKPAPKPKEEKKEKPPKVPKVPVCKDVPEEGNVIVCNYYIVQFT